MANTTFSYLRPKFSGNQMAAATGDPTIYDKAAQLYLQTAPSRYQTALQLDALSRSEAENQKSRDLTTAENEKNRLLQKQLQEASLAQQKSIADQNINLSTQQLGAQMAAYDKSLPTTAGTLAKAGMLGMTQLDKITGAANWVKDWDMWKKKPTSEFTDYSGGFSVNPESSWFSGASPSASSYYNASTPQDYNNLLFNSGNINPTSWLNY